MTNDSIKTYPVLTRPELLAFLKSQRPDVSESCWENCDPMVILPWLLPAYEQYRKTQEGKATV